MFSIKSKIAHSFNRAADSYEQVAQVQLASAEFLLKNLVAKLQLWDIDKLDTALDVGTGTGFVPSILIKNYPWLRIDLNDIAWNMLKLAETKIKSLAKYNLILGDLEQLKFKSYDLITANLALQWANDLNKILNKIYANSKILAFSCLLQGTFQEWLDQFNELAEYLPVSNYPDKIELQNFLLSLEKEHYWFASKSFSIDFTNPLAFMGYLKKMGANLAVKQIPFGYLRNIIKSQQPLTATYKVFFAILVRPKK